MTQYVIREGWCSLFVSVPGAGPDLDKYVSAGKNHLFYLEKEDIRDITDDYVFLFMREVEGADIGSCHDASRPREFKLILCCPCQDISFMFRKAKLPNSSKAHNRSMHQVDVRHSLYATLIGVRNEIWGQTSTWASPPQFLEHKGHCGSGISSNSPLAEPINWHQMFSGRHWSGPFLNEALPLGQIILSSERSGAEEAEIETAFAGEYLACLKSKLPLHNASLVNEIGADNVRVAWVKITILQSVVGLNYWNGPADPFFYSPPDTDAVELHYWNMAASPFYPPYDIDWSQSFQIS